MCIVPTCLVEHIRALNKTTDGPPLELVFHCVVIPPDIPPERSSGLFEDAAEEEALEQECTVNASRKLDLI
jgi:hypothetical protein